jgi:4'-phosphopantetheinyl transferase
MIYINDQLELIDLEAAMARLSQQRREQVMRYKFDSLRRQSAAAYLLLCDALEKEYGITEAPVFEYGEHGKPQLSSPLGRQGGVPLPHFNLSHCREAAACIVARQPVGIDVESIRRYNDSLARYTMNDEELRRIADAESPEVEFTRLWTQKEAVLKLIGTGLRNDMKSVLTDAPYLLETVVNTQRGYAYSVARKG